MLEGFGLRAIRDALPGNPVAQERLTGTILTAMAIADVRIIHTASIWSRSRRSLGSSEAWQSAG